MAYCTTTIRIALLCLLNIGAAMADQPLAEYAIPEKGFKVAMPSKPHQRAIRGTSQDGTLTVYESTDAGTPPAKYSVFVGTPEQQGIFEPASMDAYLEGHVASMVRTVESGKLLKSARAMFRGRPALEYEFSHRIAGVPYIGRGITLMIDGGHMRLSMWHPTGAENAKEKYRRFVDSFQLVPIQFTPAKTSFVDPRGISFVPPQGWIQEKPENSVQVARYSNLTRSLQLLVAGVAAYSCDSFVSEIRASGRFKSAKTVRLADQQFVKVLSFEDIPRYKIRLVTVQYCLNSQAGAAVLGGSEEEGMFARWETVYEGTASTLRTR